MTSRSRSPASSRSGAPASSCEGNFTAPVNVALEVGNVNETVTVLGESPVVDVTSNRATVVVNRDMMDAIPTATRSLQARAYLIPGTMVTPVGSGQTSMTIYGSQAADQVVMVDGMRLNLLEGQGQFSGIYLNDGMAQEISYDTGAQSAEVAQGGLRVNMIPREGGNQFSGIFFIQGANGPLASDNRSDEVKQFIPEPLGLAYTYEINPSFGGPIKRDKIWFYFTYKLQDTKSYTTLPDRSQGTQQNWPNYSYVTRVTWQATPRDKFRVYVDKQMNGQRYEGLGATTTIEASHQLWTPRGMTPQFKWMQTTTNRLMLEAGITMYDLNFRREPQPGVGPIDLPRFEIVHRRQLRHLRRHHGQLDEELHVGGVGELRHRLAHGQDRHELRVGAPGPHVAESESRRHPAVALHQRRADAGAGPQHADRRIDRADERRLRLLRAGRVDDEPADAERRRPLRLLQRRSAGAVGAGQPVGGGARSAGGGERAELARLGDPPRGRCTICSAPARRRSRSTRASTSPPPRSASPKRSTR